MNLESGFLILFVQNSSAGNSDTNIKNVIIKKQPYFLLNYYL